MYCRIQGSHFGDKFRDDFRAADYREVTEIVAPSTQATLCFLSRDEF